MKAASALMPDLRSVSDLQHLMDSQVQNTKSVKQIYICLHHLNQQAITIHNHSFGRSYSTAQLHTRPDK